MYIDYPHYVDYNGQYIKSYFKSRYKEEGVILSMETVAVDAQCKMRTKLIKAQQGELDAVILYRKLGELVKDKECSKKLFKIAADEGRHAAILRRYTGEVLKAREGKSILISSVYKVFGLNFTLKVLSIGEYRASKDYSLFVEDFPNVKDIVEDEALHAEIMKNMVSR